MSQVNAATIMRHPLASKRYIMVFRQDGEESMEVFELLSRYEAVGPIGQGTYGYVCSARDNTLVEEFQLDPPPEYEGKNPDSDEEGETQELTVEEKEDLYDQYTLVAVKKLRQLFENNQPRMWLCATREIQLMMSFQHDNVMSASDFFIPLGGVESLNYSSILHLQHTFDSVYVVMKKMDYTLREVLDSIVVTPRDIAAARAEAGETEAVAPSTSDEGRCEVCENENRSSGNGNENDIEHGDEGSSDQTAQGQTEGDASTARPDEKQEVQEKEQQQQQTGMFSEGEVASMHEALDEAIAKQVSLSSFMGGSGGRNPVTPTGVFGSLELSPTTIASSSTFGPLNTASTNTNNTNHKSAAGTNSDGSSLAASTDRNGARADGVRGSEVFATGADGAGTEEAMNEQNTNNNNSGEGEEDEPLLDPRTGQPLHPLRRDYRKFILYQILRGVGYLHRCPVIHRDLKPENVMLDRSYNTCITDFGQGRDVGVFTRSSAANNLPSASSGSNLPASSTTRRANNPGAAAVGGSSSANDVLNDESFMAEYVQTMLDNTTQWYAAPETLTLAVASTGVGFIDHETFHGVDVWSVGCIAAEMLTGRPLFYTTSLGGIGQLISIIDLLGEPRSDAVSYICELRDKRNRDVFVAAISRVIAKFKGRTSVLKQVLRSPYGDEDEDEVNLICRCLSWDPRTRSTIQEALESPFFTNDGYEPIIDPEDTAKRVPSVRPEEISEPVSGRAFLWKLFVQRHPEVGELWKSLMRKHFEEEENMHKTAVPATTEGHTGGEERSAEKRGPLDLDEEAT